MKPKSGSELMLGFARGDEHAFESLVAMYETEVLNFFYRLTLERHAAEDMAQDLFLRIYQSRKTYRPRTRFRYFLYRIARNLWIDLYRKRKSGPVTVAMDRGSDSGHKRRESSLMPPDTVTPTPEERAIQDEQVDRLAKAVARLPEKQREVIALSIEGGFKYAEISKILKVPVGTIKSRMHTAVVLLRKWMREK